MGDDQGACEVCGKKLSEYRVLRMELGHRESGKPLAKLWYRVPLCDEHRAGMPLDVVMEWEKDAEPRS
jgi:hypothetical protein